jgi:hypothetical protein
VGARSATENTKVWCLFQDSRSLTGSGGFAMNPSRGAAPPRQRPDLAHHPVLAKPLAVMLAGGTWVACVAS